MKQAPIKDIATNRKIINGWQNLTGTSIVFINYHSHIMVLMLQKKNLHIPMLLEEEDQIIPPCNFKIQGIKSLIN